MKVSFSGHDKFECRTSWLPLVYKNKSILSERMEDIISLTGLGSNMVKSLKQWLIKLNLIDGTVFNTNAEVIFHNDPYLENIDSLWILHAYVTQNKYKATLYYLFFNTMFLNIFSKNTLLGELKKWCELNGVSNISEHTLDSDIDVLLRNYLNSDRSNEFYNGLFKDLNIIQKVDNDYIFNTNNPAPLSDEAFLYILLFVIKDYKNDTISVKDLQFGTSSLQRTLCMNEEKLLHRLEQLEYVTDGKILYHEASGIRQIYIKQMPDMMQSLKAVYGGAK